MCSYAAIAFEHCAARRRVSTVGWRPVTANICSGTETTAMRRLFREPTHRPIAVVRMVLGLLLLGDALRVPSRPYLGQILTVLLGMAMLISGGAELLPRSWHSIAGILRIVALIGWSSCIVIVLIFLARAR